MTTHRYQGHRQRGSTLIEVLVTVVLVSAGLLGLAGMQIATVQTTNSAAQRFEATVLAKDIIERMRANRPRAIAGDYNIAIGAAAPGAGLVGADLTAWKAALLALPNGDGSVAVVNNVATVNVQWTDAADENPGNTRVGNVFLRTDL